MAVDAKAAALRAVEVAAREIERLAQKEKLTGFDVMDLERLSKVCLSYDDHELHWMSKLDPEKLPDELLQRLLKEGGTSDGARRRGRPRADG